MEGGVCLFALAGSPGIHPAFINVSALSKDLCVARTDAPDSNQTANAFHWH